MLRSPLLRAAAAQEAQRDDDHLQDGESDQLDPRPI
jgi:hypothetical protein